MTDHAEGPGAALKSAREALHVSTREVSEALNLPLKVIEALEANDYEKLPSPVFTRGYLRSYARLLELDPDAISARYSQPVEVPTALSAEFDAVASMDGGFRGVAPWMLAAAAGAALLLVVLLVVWLWPEGSEDTDVAVGPLVEEHSVADLVTPADGSSSFPAVTPAAADAAVDEPVIGVEQPAAEDTDAVFASAAAVASDSSEREVLSAENAADAEIVVDTAADSAPTPAGVHRLTPFGDDLLVLSFTADCWVEIKDRDGNRLYGDLNRSGRTLQLTGRAPFRVLLGYAPGVEMTFNGNEVDVAASTRNNVASIMVGR